MLMQGGSQEFKASPSCRVNPSSKWEGKKEGEEEKTLVKLEFDAYWFPKTKLTSCHKAGILF